MGKRLVRINSGNIFQELEKLKGVELNAISQTGKTYFGKLVSVTNEYLTMSDTRQHSHKFAIRDLYEVVYDAHSKL